MSDTNETVAKLIKDALMKATHSEAHLLVLAEALLDPRIDDPLPAGAARKMKEAEAFAAATAVTRMMRRHGLNPSYVCKGASVANNPKEYFAFHLTQGEMDASGNAKAPLKPGRRIHKGLAPYVRLARTVAGMAAAPEADLLQELATAVAGYLAPFASADRSPWELLAEDLAMLATYFGKTRDGSDGEPVDLKRFFSDAVRTGVGYSVAKDRMMPEPEEPVPDAGFWQAPTVPLFARTVAVGAVECRTWDETVDGERFVVPLGEMKANVVEVYHLELVPDGRGLRTVVFAEPWTALFGKPNDGHARSWGDSGLSHFEQGTPFSGGLHIPAGEAPFGVSFADDALAFGSPEYERHVRDLLVSAEEAGPHTFEAGYCYEMVNVARRIDLDAEVLETLMRRAGDEKWRTMLRFLKEPPPFADAFVLPRSVKLTGGATSDEMRDRMEEALHGDGQAVVRGLTEAVTKRARAMDDFMAERIDAERWRRDRFRRLMRS